MDFFPNASLFPLPSSLGDLDLIHLKHLILFLFPATPTRTPTSFPLSFSLPIAVIHLRPSTYTQRQWRFVVTFPRASRDLKAWPFESVSSRLGESESFPSTHQQKKEKTTNIRPRHDIISTEAYPLLGPRPLESVLLTACEY